MGFFFATWVYLRGLTCEFVWPPNTYKSLRKMNLRLLVTTCWSVWPGLKENSQLSVSILTNIFSIFLQHLRRILTSLTKHKQMNTMQQQIQNHLKKVDVCRFPFVSNKAVQELNSVTGNKRGTQTFMFIQPS